MVMMMMNINMMIEILMIGVDCRCSPWKLVAVVQLDHGSGHHVWRGVRAPAGVLVQLVVGSCDLAWGESKYKGSNVTVWTLVD